ncbi:sugar ABC transporter substrate-binding protein [soil metagenome]
MFRSRITRGLATVGIAAIVAAGLAACGPAASTNTTGENQDEDNISLRVMIFSSNEAHLELLNGIADVYMADHPEVTEIEFQSVPSTELRTVIQTQILAGEGPDLSWGQDGLSAEFINADLVVDVAPALKADESYEYDDLIPNALALWNRGEAQYGIPFSTSTMGLFYNADMFNAAGVPLPEELIAEGKWTWDEYREILKQVTATTGLPGYVARDFQFGAQLDRIVPIWYAYGARPWSEDGTTCEFTEQPMVDSMQLLHDMIFEDKTYPQVGQTVDFFAGGAASTNAFVSSSSLLKEVPFNWGFVPMPAGPDGYTAALYQSSFVAYKSSRNPVAAVDFLKFMTNPENSAQLAEFFPPIRSSLLTADQLAAVNGVLSAEQLEEVVVDGVNNGVFVPVHPRQGQVVSAIRAPMDAMFKADADIPAVMESICAAIDPLLAPQ